MIHAVAEWVFSYLCHQDAARSWAPGETPLALCQRCVGVYAGASLMVLLLPLMRFKPARWLGGLHAIFLLQMIVLGLHVVPHPAIVRTLSGQLFIIGASYFVWNNARHRWTFFQGHMSSRYYLLAMVGVLALLMSIVHAPFAFAAPVIELLALFGLSTILGAAVWTILDVASGLSSWTGLRR